MRPEFPDMRYRNDNISRLHHVVGQILDRGGATDEVTLFLNSMSVIFVYLK